MTLITVLNNNSEDTFVERDIRETGRQDNSTTRDSRIRGQAVTVTTRDLRMPGAMGDITYLGSLGNVGHGNPDSTLDFIVPFVSAGSHVILVVSHSTGATVTGAVDSRSNTYTVDQPSTQNGDLNVAVVSAHISNNLIGGDTIQITFSGNVTNRVVIGEVFSGILATNYVDKTASNSAIGNTVNTGTTGQTTSPNQLVFGGLTIGTPNSTFEPDVGYTDLQEMAWTNRKVTGAFKVVNTEGAYNITGTLT